MCADLSTYHMDVVLSSRALDFVDLRRGFIAALALVMTSFGALDARADNTGSNAECRSNPHLGGARELYEDLQFDEAAQKLQRALEFANNCRWDLGEIYRLKAFVDAINGERERCHRDFEIFLALSPDYKMPADIPPKIRDCFEDANAVAPSRRELGLKLQAPTNVQPNAPVALAVEVVDPLRLVDQVKVFFRREGVKVYTVVSARADDNVSVVIPALAVTPDPKGYRMEYLVRAVDRWGGVLAEEGTARRPIRFDVQPGGGGAGELLTRWWFWAGVLAGVAAIGGSAFAIASATGGGDSVTLTIRDRGVAGGS